MISVEQIELAFTVLERPAGNQWHLHTLVPGRVHLSLSYEGDSTVFIEGDALSFGRIPALRGIEHREDAQDVESSRVFGALRITAPPDPHGNQAVAFIAYELARNLESEPEIDNVSLLAKVSWILRLLGTEPDVLSVERQRGLVGECILLRRLLQIGRSHGVSSQTVLDRWWGPSGGKRDFAAIGIAVEVKSTALNTRTHHISSIDQLEPLAPGEQAYLFSVGIKSEPTFERKLPTFVSDVVSEIVGPDGNSDPDAIHAFSTKLASAGYHSRFDELYASGPGLLPNAAMPSKLFRVDDLDRVRLSSFKGNQLPAMVTAVSYDLDVSAEPLGEAETEAVLLSLIKSAAL